MHTYSHYEEMEELNEMTDESLMLDIDIIEKRHEEEIAEKLAENNRLHQQELAEKLVEKDMILSEKDKEIALLKKQLEEAGISK